MSSPVVRKIADGYHVRFVPTTVLTDSIGQVLGRWVGPPPEEKIEQLLGWLHENYGGKNEEL